MTFEVWQHRCCIDICRVLRVLTRDRIVCFHFFSEFVLSGRRPCRRTQCICLRRYDWRGGRIAMYGGGCLRFAYLVGLGFIVWWWVIAPFWTRFPKSGVLGFAGSVHSCFGPAKSIASPWLLSHQLHSHVNVGMIDCLWALASDDPCTIIEIGDVMKKPRVGGIKTASMKYSFPFLICRCNLCWICVWYDTFFTYRNIANWSFRAFFKIYIIYIHWYGWYHTKIPGTWQTWVNGSVASKTVLDDLSKGFDTSGDKFFRLIFLLGRTSDVSVDDEWWILQDICSRHLWNMKWLNLGRKAPFGFA